MPDWISVGKDGLLSLAPRAAGRPADVGFIDISFRDIFIIGDVFDCMVMPITGACLKEQQKYE